MILTMWKKYNVLVRGLCSSGMLRSVGSYRRFGTACLFHFQGSANSGIPLLWLPDPRRWDRKSITERDW